MTGKLSKNFHGVGIGPLSKILAVKYHTSFSNHCSYYYNNDHYNYDGMCGYMVSFKMQGEKEGR